MRPLSGKEGSFLILLPVWTTLPRGPQRPRNTVKALSKPLFSYFVLGRERSILPRAEIPGLLPIARPEAMSEAPAAAKQHSTEKRMKPSRAQARQ